MAKGGVTVKNEIINLEYLREYMDKNNISQTELAKLIGVDYTTVYRIFRGDRRPGTKFISGLISGRLDIEYDKIFLNTALPTGKINKGIESA